MATLFFWLRILYFEILTWRSINRVREVNVRRLLNEWGTANLPNFDVEYASYLLFLTSQITTDISFDIIKTDQHNSCLYFCVLSLFVLDACDFFQWNLWRLVSEPYQRPKTPLKSMILSKKPYFSPEFLLKIQTNKGRRKERKKERRKDTKCNWK